MMSHLRSGLFPGLVFQFDFRVKLLFWFICLSNLNANWEEKLIWILCDVKQVNSVPGERGSQRERRLIADLSLTLFRCGLVGSDVSVNGLEVKFPMHSTFLTIITQTTRSVVTILTCLHCGNCVATQAYLLSMHSLWWCEMLPIYLE